MEQMLINQMNVMNRRLEYEETQRSLHPGQPYVNYLATVQRRREERKSLFARLFSQRSVQIDSDDNRNRFEYRQDCQPC